MKGQIGTSTQMGGRKSLRHERGPGAPGRKAWPSLVRQLERANKSERAAEQAIKEQRAEATRLSRAKPLSQVRLTTEVELGDAGHGL